MYENIPTHTIRPASADHTSTCSHICPLRRDKKTMLSKNKLTMPSTTTGPRRNNPIMPMAPYSYPENSYEVPNEVNSHTKKVLIMTNHSVAKMSTKRNLLACRTNVGSPDKSAANPTTETTRRMKSSESIDES